MVYLSKLPRALLTPPQKNAGQSRLVQIDSAQVDSARK
jgi:hypothetical protein